MKFLPRLLSVRYTLLSIFLLTMLIGCFLVSRLPNVYESSALLAIDDADGSVFKDESVSSEAISQRIQLVISNVLRRENVLRNLQTQGSLALDSSDTENEEAIKRFLENASIDPDNVSVINRYTGKQGLLSFGLIVSYRDETPELAFNLTSMLVDDVLRGDRAISDPSNDQASAFLTQQLDASLNELSEIESRIAEFKEQNSIYLPELYPVAIRQLFELNSQIERSREDITELRRDIAANDTDLAIASPEALLFSDDGTRIESPDERLQQLRIDLAFALSRYAPLHPQVKNLEREIASLEQFSGQTDTRELEVEYETVSARLASLRDRYSDEHPDTVAAIREVQRLQQALDTAASLNSTPRESSQPSNPVYNRLQAKGSSLSDEIAREIRGLEQLEERRVEVESQLARMPGVEQQFTELQRLREREEQTYSELESRLTDAELNANLLNADLLERFVVVEPPIYPLKPIAPRRTLLLGLLSLLALTLASIGAVLKLTSRDAIWDKESLENLAGSQILPIPRFN